MDIAYFPGCSLHGIAREYGRSAALVCRRLGIRLVEVQDWNCCGATAAHSLDREFALGLNARNLSIVSRMGLDRVTAPCSGCFSRLKGCAHELEKSKGARESMEKRIGAPLAKLPEVTHLLQLMVETVGLESLAAAVTRPLEGLRLAAYYGCLLTRPRAVTGFDDPEQPTSMDRILQAMGAETVQWSHKAECCGGGFAASETGIVVDLGGQVLEAARQSGADAIVVACPMCQVNLDTRQQAIEEARGVRYGLPVIYFTQLMGLACGFSAGTMKLGRMLVSPLPLLRRAGLA
ncbi:MAG TPA: CoB--CoM heterodisulfide reductase iron-sulfur subunit B family protein [Syntrophales bacterium]|nr:CoB--CoM heterodisulfide reductase iron-sulfur subunit B family protein [Syntrophales bacterium]